MENQVAVPNVGEVLVSSWGYDQTNVDFYEVVRASAASVWVVPMSQKVVRVESWASEMVEPAVKKDNAKPMMLRWNKNGYAKVGYSEWAKKYDGKPQFQSHWA
jgi:hypothetical protein